METITNAGRFAGLTATDHDASNDNGLKVKLAAAPDSVDDLQVGDYIRVGKEMRRVEAVDTNDYDYTIATALTTVTLPESGTPKLVVNKQNGFRYDITFSGAAGRTGTATTTALMRKTPTRRREAIMAKRVMASAPRATPEDRASARTTSTHGGNGCTKDRRATHANARLSVSGNLNNLICDSNGLVPSDVLSATATVTRVDPSKVTFASAPAAPALAVGDQIGIEGQVRTVVSINSAVIEVDRPFEEDSFSKNTNIFDAGTPVNRLEPSSATTGKYSAIIQCFATDMPALQVSGTDCNVERRAWAAGLRK